jgi:hypothetical protein
MAIGASAYCDSALKKLASSRRNFLQLEPDKTQYVNSDVADSTPVMAAPLALDLPRRKGKWVANQIAAYLFSPCKPLTRQEKKFNNHGALRRF